MNTRLNDIEITMHLLDGSMKADLYEFNSIAQTVDRFSLLPVVNLINIIADRYESKINEWKKLYREKETLTREPVECRTDERINNGQKTI